MYFYSRSCVFLSRFRTYNAFELVCYIRFHSPQRKTRHLKLKETNIWSVLSENPITIEMIALTSEMFQPNMGEVPDFQPRSYFISGSTSVSGDVTGAG